jgi:hypothetical protein
MTRTPEDIAADLLAEITPILEGTVWEEPFSLLEQPGDREKIDV